MRSSDLRISSIIVEVKYDHGYVYWDRCGTMWRELARRHPTLEALQVDTKEAKFVVSEGGPTYSLAVDTNKAHCQVAYPTSRKGINELSDDFISIVRDTLEIDVYTRTGCRVVWEWMGPKDEILKTLAAGRVLPDRIPTTEKQLELHSVDLTFRSEAESHGSTIRVTMFERQFKLLGLPSPVRVDDSGYSGSGVSVDVDVYVSGPIDVEQFVASAFLESSYRKAHGAVEHLFG